MTTAAKLRAAKALIEDPAHWCQGHLALTKRGHATSPHSPYAVQWCARGACLKVAQHQDLTEHLMKAEPAPVRVNDVLGHKAVMAMFDRAIELASAEEAR